MARTTPYPLPPRHVPAELTAPSSQYQTQALIVLTCVIAFFAGYLFLIVSTLTLAIVALVLVPFPWGLIPAGFLALLFLFLIKGFFRKETPGRSFRLEVHQDEHPRLFEFIERLCAETQAPLPHRVFLSPEVNAAVFYDDDSLLSLVMPPPKNLLIGMGLVNFLNLSEFKAVLAHELGHFSQNSMLLGRYVYSASRIMADLAHGNDWVDRFVLGLRDDPNGGAGVLLGWCLWAPIWCFRKGLEICFLVVNYFGAALSRQEEFNADLVAVSVSGSDAIVHALSRIGFAAESLDQAFEDLRIAADHGLYTLDLFHHQNHAAAYLRRVRKQPHLGEPPVSDDPRRPVWVFDDQDATPDMWATHPSCSDRERNAKRTYIRCPIDERSPWLLFDDAVVLRERITWKFYRVVVGLSRDVPLEEAERVQRFIDEEHAETTYDPRYHGAYDNRPLQIRDLDALEQRVRKEPWNPETLAGVVSRLHGNELKARMKELNLLREEYNQLLAIDRGLEQPPGGVFRFRGRRYEEREARRLVEKVSRELEEDHAWLGEMDERVFRAHYQMARGLGRQIADELLARYRFHLAVQEIDQEISRHRPAVESALAFLSGATQLNYDEFHEVRSIFRDAHDALVKGLTRADRLRLPRLKNMEEGAILGTFLMDRHVVKNLRPTAQRLTARWIGKFLSQLGAVQDRIRRIHFKSLGGILALQEQIRARWPREGKNVAVEEEPVEAIEEAEHHDRPYRLREE